MSVQRYDPFPNAISLRSMMDRLMDESFLRPTSGASTEQMLPIDVAETEDAYEIRASIPGVDPEHLQITVQDNMVTIRGDTQEEQEQQGRRYLLHERRMGRFERTFMLPNSVDADKANAKFENGVLTLTLSKSESAKPKQIKVAHS
jgi:HSP20 family protein